MAKKVGRVNLYGHIDSWDDNSSSAFSERFNQALAESNEVELHVHCYGGSVFEGNVIYNLIKTSPKPVHAVVDGIAASMGAIIIMACTSVKMAENALVMVHAPSCFCEGTSQDLIKASKLLASLEKQFVKVISERTGKTVADVAEWLKGDNWFSAEDAIAEGLADEITKPAIDITPPAEDELKTATAKLLYDRYAAKLNNLKPKFKNNSKMTSAKKQEIIARYSLTTVTAESSDDDIMSAVEAKLAASQNEVQQLKATNEQKTNAEIEAIVAELPVTAAEKETFRTIGKTAGVEALKVAAKAIQPAVKLTDILKEDVPASGTHSDRAKWTFDEWNEKDPAGLDALPEDEFDKLYRAKYPERKRK